MLDKRKDYSELRPFFSGLSRESTKKRSFWFFILQSAI